MAGTFRLLRVWGWLLALLVVFGSSICFAEEYGGVEFPQGAASFADAVVDYVPGTGVTAPFNTKENALGVPDSGSADNFVSLGVHGQIILQFTDNALTTNGNSTYDLWVFEVGDDTEPTSVAISKDGTVWFDVGATSGATSGIDIDAYIGAGVVAGEKYYFVKLVDVNGEGGGIHATDGADIDAVGAISSTLIATTFTLTYTAGENGSIDGQASQTVQQGQDGTTVTAVPATGYHFVGWSDGSKANPRTDTNVTADVSVSALFAETTITGRVPDTGQTKCYDNTGEIPCPNPGEPFYGQDGNFLINPPSYTKLDAQGNDLPDDAASWAMVRDNVTGLIWEAKQNKDGVPDNSNPHDADNLYSWYDSNPETNGGYAGTPGEGTDTEDFIDALNSANYGGYSDWRLPTMQELRIIINYDCTCIDPGINTNYFINNLSDLYWSASTDASNTYRAWLMNFSVGRAEIINKFYSFYARAVRGGQAEDSGKFILNGDGSITDKITGLMWEQKTDDGGLNDKDNFYTWEGALSWVASLNASEYLGYNDWRLPAIKELASIVDFSRYSPAIETEVFQNTPSSSIYWSSTTDTLASGNAYYIFFGSGHDVSYHKLNLSYVRAVRGGHSESLGYLIISTPTILEVPAGSSFSVPMNLTNTNAVGIEGIEITLTYDPSVLTATGATLTGGVLETQNYSIQTNTDQTNTDVSGQVGVAISANSDLFSGQGVFGYLNFQVIGNVDDVSSLTFTSAQINQADVNVQNGSVKVVSSGVPDTGTITGQVTTELFGQSVNVVGAVVRVVGTDIWTTTDALGMYTLPDLPVGTYELEIVIDQFQTLTVPGVTVTADGTTNVPAASTVLSLSPACTEAELEAVRLDEQRKWDVNGDGLIGLEEAVNALRIVSGATSPPANVLILDYHTRVAGEIRVYQGTWNSDEIRIEVFDAPYLENIGGITRTVYPIRNFIYSPQSDQVEFNYTSHEYATSSQWMLWKETNAETSEETLLNYPLFDLSMAIGQETENGTILLEASQKVFPELGLSSLLPYVELKIMDFNGVDFFIVHYVRDWGEYVLRMNQTNDASVQKYLLYREAGTNTYGVKPSWFDRFF